MVTLNSQLALKVARRASRIHPRFFSNRLDECAFVVGFNNSGKSSGVEALTHLSELSIYPDEGNGELWFRGHFPWISSHVEVPPIWVAPEKFIRSVKDSNGHTFERARAQLGAYQWLTRGRKVLNDSGMLAALAPDIAATFPDGKFIHFIRDGRLASYITARLEWSRIIRSPSKFIQFNCPIRFLDVLRKMAHYWVWTTRRMDMLAEKVPGSVLELRYEDWWQKPELMLDAVADFLELRPQLFSSPKEPKRDLTSHLLAEMSREEHEVMHEVLQKTLIKKGYDVGLNETRIRQLPYGKP